MERQDTDGTMAGPMPAAEQEDRAVRAVRQWRAERPDLDPAPMVVLGRLGEVAQRILADRLAPLYAAHGVQVGEFDVLATLRRAGAPYRLTPTDLYGALMISSGGMTSRIDRLERAGLVARHPHPTDRRGTLVGLTEAGVERIDRLVDLHLSEQRKVLAALSAEEQDHLSVLLEKMLKGLDNTGSEPI